MEIDSAPRSAIDWDKDGMDTSLDNSLSHEQQFQPADRPEETGLSGQAQPASLQQQSGVGGDTSTMAQSPAQALPKSFLAQDLLSLFGLQPLAASVARTDPVTGEKINKMRKSYEGKVKNFKISGKARAAQHHPEHGMSLSDMVRWPEEEWNNQKVFGKLVMSGLPPATTMKLEKVMQMQPGPIPNGASWHSTSWEEIIGIEKSKPIPAGPDPRAKSAVSAAKTNGYVNGNRPYAINTQATNSEAARPKRTAKKRRYDDLSFEGYGEGYVDDEADIVDAGGYSSGDGGSKSGASKKRKMSTKDFGVTSPTISDRGGSYGVGMIGVGYQR